MLKRWRTLGNRGDTIVEVLIVVAIIATVIGSAYAVANRSQKANQQVQEHTQALKIAEGQLESLKNVSQPVADTKFCFRADGTMQKTGFESAVPAADAANENLGGYPNACKQSFNGGSCEGGLCFSYVITKTGDALYTATVRWDGATARIDNVSLVYRMPQ